VAPFVLAQPTEPLGRGMVADHLGLGLDVAVRHLGLGQVGVAQLT
jgi:hypothetical protein